MRKDVAHSTTRDRAGGAAACFGGCAFLLWTHDTRFVAMLASTRSGAGGTECLRSDGFSIRAGFTRACLFRGRLLSAQLRSRHQGYGGDDHHHA